MFTMGSVEQGEGEAPSERKPEVDRTTFAKILHAFATLYEKWCNKLEALESRRHPGDRGPDPDYAAGLQDLENLEKLIRIAKDHEPDIRIINSKGNGNNSWPNKLVLGVCVILAASGIIGAIVTYAQVATVTAEIHSYINSNNQRLDSDEGRIRDTERRLDRGAGLP